MTPLFMRAEAPETPAPTQAGEVLDAMGLIDTLAERLIQDVNGHSFEPQQISLSGDLMAYITLLLRREPVGGAEPLIRENQRQVQGQALPVLNHALAGSADAPRALLQDLLHQARARKEQFEAAFRQIDEHFQATQERLYRWQGHAGQRSASLVADLWRWLFGGPDHMSLPEVVALWNEREYLALQRMARAAALACCTYVIDLISGLLNNLDAMIEQARQARVTFQQELDALRQSTVAYAPWSLRIDTHVVADTLAGFADGAALAAALLRRLAESDPETALEEHIRAVARQEASRLVQGRTIADLIALEASTADTAGEDPLILVGQWLLAVLQRPTWQIARAARPRSEMIQVTPDGTPVYSLEGLSTAAYGGGADRLGFVRVQMAVALDDLVGLLDSDEGFQAMLRQRNLYVLDELAAAAGDGQVEHIEQNPSDQEFTLSV